MKKFPLSTEEKAKWPWSKWVLLPNPEGEGMVEVEIGYTPDSKLAELTIAFKNLEAWSRHKK